MNDTSSAEKRISGEAKDSDPLETAAIRVGEDIISDTSRGNHTTIPIG